MQNDLNKNVYGLKIVIFRRSFIASLTHRKTKFFKNFGKPIRSIGYSRYSEFLLSPINNHKRFNLQS